MNSSKYPSRPVLLVDDEEQALQSFTVTLRSSGINHILTCSDGKDVLPLLTREECEVMLLDLWMPQVSGEEVLAQVKVRHPELPVIIVTGVNEVETAVQCIRQGAVDYLVKPVERGRLVNAVRRAIEMQELRRENMLLRQGLLCLRLTKPQAFAHIVQNSHAMRSIFQYVEAVAFTFQPVLITGETGVGKELIARAVHEASEREGPFVPVNIAGLDDNVFADTLFGHRRGAFTGADEARNGLVEQASGGTLFLDEIGDLSEPSQLKLLRLLQEQEYFPLGSDMPKRSDTRIVLATNIEPSRLVGPGGLRKDLFYRLSTHHVNVPPLRERMEDLPVLLNHFLDEAAQTLRKKRPSLPREALILLGTYPFPGNVRELRSMVFDAVSSHRSGILSLDSFRKVLGKESPSKTQDAPGEDASLLAFSERLPTLKEAEKLLVAEAMARAQGNQGIAAKLLGISRQALNRRLLNSREEKA
jgi:DNA-binding NtrC family response regulator